MVTENAALDPARSADASAPRTVTLQHAGGTTPLEVLEASDGRSAIDVAKLTKETGLTALDYGFVNTAATRSSIRAAGLSIRFDAMSAVTGPYAREILVNRLGFAADSIMNARASLATSTRSAGMSARKRDAGL